MTCRPVWPLLTLAAVISLGGCATPPPVPVLAPCPELPQPPASLLVPAESPAARERLERLLPALPPPASGIAPGSTGGLSGGGP